MIKSAMVALACPLGNHKVSFRLVDEHGSGRPFAGLPYRLHDSRGQTLTGNLDSDGFAQIVNLHCGPQVLDLSEITSQYIDPWYEELSIRKNFSLPLTALQIAVEQSPTGPRRADGKTYMAEARAQQEGAQFLRVESAISPKPRATCRSAISPGNLVQPPSSSATRALHNATPGSLWHRIPTTCSKSKRFAHTARCSRETKSFVP